MNVNRFIILTDIYGRFRSVAIVSEAEPEVVPGEHGFLWVDTGVDGTLSAPVLKMWDEDAGEWRVLTVANGAIDAAKLASNIDATGIGFNADQVDGQHASAFVLKAGGGVAEQVALWTDADTIGGDANLTFDGTALTLLGNANVQHDLTLGIGGSYDPTLSLQTYRNLAPFALSVGHGTFDGVIDDVLYWGYNPLDVEGVPSLAFGLEADYYYAGVHGMEWNFAFKNADRSVSLRPMYFYIDRDDASVITWTFVIGTTAPSRFAVLGSAGASFLNIDKDGKVRIHSNQTDSQLAIDIADASSHGIKIRGAASQAGDLLRLTDSSGNILDRISADGRVLLYPIVPVDVDYNALLSDATVNLTADNNYTFCGCLTRIATTDSSYAINGYLVGGAFYAQTLGSGARKYLHGGDFYVKNLGTGAITEAVGGQFQYISSAAAAATRWKGVLIKRPTLSAGTIATAYGLYIEDQDKATTNYAIYTNAGYISFGGEVLCHAGLTIDDNTHITLGTTTGSKIGLSASQKLGFFGASPIVRPSALTAQLTTVSADAPGTPDYAYGAGSVVLPWGFTTQDEFLTFVSVMANLQIRLAELEDKLGHTAGLGLITH